LAVEVRGKLGERAEHEIGWMRGERVNADAVGNASGPNAGVARGFNVDVGIADQHGFGRMGAEIAQDHFDAVGIGLFLLETVSTVDHAKKFG